MEQIKINNNYENNNFSKNNTLERKNLLLGITGSVASIKINQLVDLLKNKLNVNICIIPTANAINFVDDFETKFNKHMPDLKDRLEFLKLKNETENSLEKVVFSFCDKDEWASWQKRNDPVLHIELKKWADLFLIAPLDANTLAKLSNGICDNLLTCVARAWDIENIKQHPIIICPAMNTFMFNHPLTSRHLTQLTEEFGFTLIECVEKTLICGDRGIGAMAEIETILSVVAFLINRI